MAHAGEDASHSIPTPSSDNSSSIGGRRHRWTVIDLRPGGIAACARCRRRRRISARTVTLTPIGVERDNRRDRDNVGAVGDIATITTITTLSALTDDIALVNVYVVHYARCGTSARDGAKVRTSHFTLSLRSQLCH